MKFHVEPASKKANVPPHPIEGPMPSDGAFWLADQHTLRLLQDKVIRRVEGDTDEAALGRMGPGPAEVTGVVPAASPRDPDPESTRRRVLPAAASKEP